MVIIEMVRSGFFGSIINLFFEILKWIVGKVYRQLVLSIFGMDDFVNGKIIQSQLYGSSGKIENIVN